MVKICTECGGKLDFSISVRTPSYIADGRLKANEVHPIAVLGCTECSETIQVFEEYEVVEMLNSWLHEEEVSGEDREGKT